MNLPPRQLERPWCAFVVVSIYYTNALALLLGLFLSQIPISAGETDPYTSRDIDIDDSLPVLDQKVNQALDHIAANWSQDCEERAFIFAVYRKLGGRHWVDKIERWAMFASDVDKLPTNRSESVFADAPLLRSSAARLGNFSRTINVGGTYISTDKLGHFFSQGRKFYTRFQRLGTVEKAATLTARWEGLIWGQLLSGIYSNADLVANYEGFRFYQSLFNDNVVSGQKAIFQCNSGTPVRQRDFTWTDHVNDYWDEMLNPSQYRAVLVPAIERRILRLCSDYARRPERYEVHSVHALSERYRPVGMRVSNLPPIAQYLDQNCATLQNAVTTGEDLD